MGGGHAGLDFHTVRNLSGSCGFFRVFARLLGKVADLGGRRKVLERFDSVDH